MSENNGLATLASTVSEVGEERRRGLKSRLQLYLPPRQCEAMVSGLRQAAEAIEKEWPEAAKQIRELVAVAAEYALQQKAIFDFADKSLTAEAKAEIDAEIARYESGEAEVVTGGEVIRFLREKQRRRKEQNGAVGS